MAVLSGFVLTAPWLNPEDCRVVAMGTGTKCLSAQKRSSQVTCPFMPWCWLPCSLSCCIVFSTIQNNSVLRQTVQGDLVNDSHAEIIARRALLLWLYAEIQAAASQATYSA